MNSIAALLALLSAPVYASIDRAGNVIDSNGGGPLTLSSFLIVLLYFAGVFGALYFLTSKFGEHAGAIYFFGGIFALLVISSMF
jgi:hypothetical protein